MSDTLRPFFTYYGGKWRAAPHYPAPRHGLVIEPFAGAGGYSLRHAHLDVLLVDKDPKICLLWDYLIRATAADIRALPLLTDGDCVDDFDLPLGAKYLIGFWLNKGAAAPCKRPSAWMRSRRRPDSYWGETIRETIAAQIEKINHWVCWQADYAAIPDVVATWFVDPPYYHAGKHYAHPSKNIDFQHLERWCDDRQGQLIACENVGAPWGNFTPFRKIKSTPGTRGKGSSNEAVWLK